MDWKVFLTTFITIFVAELGDKTQFAAVAAASGTDHKLSVLMGVVCALGFAGALGVLAGSVLGQFLNPQIMRWVSGTMFIVVGLWIILRP